MKILLKNQTKKFMNSDVCTAIEYPLGDKDINGAIIKLRGRYPDQGKVVNMKCKEMAFIMQGSGKVVISNREIKLNKEDLVLIEPGEKYYWKGKMDMFVSCSPAWYSKQHKVVK